MSKKVEKIPVNWRLRKDAVDGLKNEAEAKGFSSIPALVNHILVLRYKT